MRSMHVGVAAVCLTTALGLAGAPFGAPPFGAADAVAAESRAAKPKTQLVGVVNINTATPDQLELLPGIGPARARAILEDREANGPYASVGDLVRVSGIGERALERIRPHLVIEGRTTAALE